MGRCRTFINTALLGAAAVFATSEAAAGTFSAFDPTHYTRASGEPVVETLTFSVQDPSAAYLLRVTNGGLEDNEPIGEFVSSSDIRINGVRVVGPSNFNPNVVVLEQPVDLLATNTIAVELRGKPGGVLTVQILGTDDVAPEIEVALSPEPNPAGWSNEPTTVTFTCSDATAGVATCPAPTVISADGDNQIVTGTAVDRAGNSATLSVTVRLDQVPPSIAATANPSPNAAGWNNADVTVVFDASDALSGLSETPASVLVTTEGAAQQVAATASDVAGNTASAEIAVSIDKTDPEIAFLSPVPGALTSADLVVADGAFSDANGVTAVTVNGSDAALSDGSFSQNLPLAFGDNVLGAVAVDIAGNTGTAQASIRRVTCLAGETRSCYQGPAGTQGVGVCSAGVQSCVAEPDPLNPYYGGCGGQVLPGTEVCNALDDDCDGALDEGQEQVEVGSDTGECTKEVQACIDGIYQAVVPGVGPSEETCNGLDDDCDGLVDDGLEVFVFGSNVGTCLEEVQACVDGSYQVTQLGQGPGEETCDGFDEDCNGVVDNGIPDIVSGTDTGLCLPEVQSCVDGAFAVVQEAVGPTFEVCNDGIDQDCNGVDCALPVMTIDSPVQGEITRVFFTDVEGTADSLAATVDVNGVTAELNAGTFVARGVPLREGPNVLTATGRDLAGNAGFATSIITVDTLAPTIGIGQPADGATVTNPTIDVTGTVNDVVVGTVRSETVSVTVNGVDAEVVNRSFSATGVPLEAGTNALVAVATDSAGNAATTDVSIDFVPADGARIELVSGQSQRAEVGSVVAQPLTARLLAADGSPAVGRDVIFRVVEGDGLASNGTEEARALVVSTAESGEASVGFRLGTRAGAANQRVRATAVGFAGTVEFLASADPGPAFRLNVVEGGNQSGEVNQPLARPLAVAAIDRNGNLIAGAEVSFRVSRGEGRFQDGSQVIDVLTDADGRARAKLVLGPTPGADLNRVTAILAGADSAAGFAATGLVPGDPANSRITGVVLDNQGTPIPGVTLRLDDSPAEAISDTQGRFDLSGVPVGTVHLTVDGRTATIPGDWPTLEYEVYVVEGTENRLPSPIFLVKLDTENSVTVGGPETVRYTRGDLPGFALEVAPQSVRFRDGSSVGEISVTLVNASKVPMAPPNGTQPPLVVTIQPPGTAFDPPARLTVPNVEALPVGAQVDMYSFDHDLEDWVSIGLGTVSRDGSLIESNPGFGVVKAGWLIVPEEPQQDDGCVQSCSACTELLVPECICAPVLDGTPQGLCAECVGGSVVPVDGEINACSSCLGGEVQVLPDGTNPPADLCTICIGGEPTAVPIDPPGPPLTAELSIPQAVSDKVNSYLEDLKKVGIAAKVETPTLQGSIESRDCCSPDFGPRTASDSQVSGEFVKFSASSRIYPPPGASIPPLEGEFSFGVVTVSIRGSVIGGVFAGLTGGLNGALGARRDGCSESALDRLGCIHGELGGNLEAKLEAKASVSGGYEIDCLIGCADREASISGTLSAGEAKWPLTLSSLTYNEPDCTAGLSGGGIDADALTFSVFVNYTLELTKEGEPSIDENATFNFLKCTIDLSRATCQSDL